MKRLSYFLLGALLLAGCGTQKTVVQPTAPVAADTQAVQKPVVYDVEAHPDVISVAEAIELLNNPGNATAIAKKHGYKVVGKYGIYRLDNYDMMMYKNCRLPKKLGTDIYEDTPKPLVKGTSSYIAMNGNVLIAVFNNTAFSNLVEQVKGLGFALVEEGYEDKYSNGQTDIYVYSTRKSIRIEKAISSSSY